MQHVDIQSYHHSKASALGSNYKSVGESRSSNTRSGRPRSNSMDFNPVFARVDVQRGGNHAPNLPSVPETPNERGRNRIVAQGPHLHAEQRIRQRSKSREAPATRAQNDVKKVVAFGRTTTVPTDATSSKPPTTPKAPGASSSLSDHRLRNEFDLLRGRVDSMEKKTKEVEQLHKLVDQLQKRVDQVEKLNKALLEDRVQWQKQARESQLLHEKNEKLEKTLQKLSESNTTLIKDLEELKKVRDARVKPVPQASPKSVRHSEVPEFRAFNSQTNRMPLKTKNNDPKSDLLFSRLPASTNREIQKRANESASNRSRQNRSTRDTHNDESSRRFAQNDENNRRFAQMSVRDESVRSYLGHSSTTFGQQQELVIPDTDFQFET